MFTSFFKVHDQIIAIIIKSILTMYRDSVFFVIWISKPFYQLCIGYF